PAREGVAELLVQALHERYEPGGGGEALDELLVVEEPVPQVRQRRQGEIEQRPIREPVERDAIGQMIECDRPPAQLVHEAAREGLRLLGAPAPYRDDDLVELAEVPRVLTVALDIGLPGWQEGKLRRLERQPP